MAIRIYAFTTELARNEGDLSWGQLVGETEDPEEIQRLIGRRPNSVDFYYAYFDESGNRLDSFEKAFLALGGDPQVFRDDNY